MAAFDFPDAPTKGQVYSTLLCDYSWNGYAWIILPPPPPIEDGDKGDILVTGAAQTWMFDPDVVSNVGRSLIGQSSYSNMMMLMGAAPISWPYFNGGIKLDGGTNSAVNMSFLSRGTTNSNISLDLVTKSANADDYLGSFSSKGWTFYARGDAWSGTSEQNDFGLGHWNGSTWKTVVNVDSVTGAFDFLVAPTVGGSPISSSTGLSTAEYTYNATTTPPPSTGGLRANSATQSAITNFYLHKINASGTDIQNALKLIIAGDKILIQDKTDATKGHNFLAAGVPTDNGTYMTVPVTWVSTVGTNITVGRVIFAVFGLGTGGAGAKTTISTSAPSGGSNGDIWYQVT